MYRVIFSSVTKTEVAEVDNVKTVFLMVEESSDGYYLLSSRRVYKVT